MSVSLCTLQRSIDYIFYIFCFQNWTIHGFYWGHYNNVIRPGAQEDSMKELLPYLAKGLLTVHTSHVYGLSEVTISSYSFYFFFQDYIDSVALLGL